MFKSKIIKSLFLILVSLSLCACTFFNKSTDVYFSIGTTFTKNNQKYMNVSMSHENELQSITQLEYDCDWPKCIYAKETEKVYYTKEDTDTKVYVYEKDVKTGKEKCIFEELSSINDMRLLNDQKLLIVGTLNSYSHPCIINLNDYSVDYGNWKNTDRIIASNYNPETDEIIFAYYDEDEAYKIIDSYIKYKENGEELPDYVKVCIWQRNEKVDIYQLNEEIHTLAYSHNMLYYTTTNSGYQPYRYDTEKSQLEKMDFKKEYNGMIEFIHATQDDLYLISRRKPRFILAKYNLESQTSSTILEKTDGQTLYDVQAVLEKK